MKEYAFAVGLVLFTILLVGGLVVGIALDGRDRSLCYRHGYPKLVGDYCVRIEHGTEVMVPIESLR